MPTPRHPRRHVERVPRASPTGASATPVNESGTLSAIGDSVMLGARNTLTDVIPGARVDAAVSASGAFVGRIRSSRPVTASPTSWCSIP